MCGLVCHRGSQPSSRNFQFFFFFSVTPTNFFFRVMTIPINIMAGKPLIFDIHDVVTLREQYHICGTLVGILPQIPQQNVFMGPPLELMPEDVYYLVEELGVAHVVNDKEVHEKTISQLTDQDLKSIQHKREAEHRTQTDQYKEKAWAKRQQALEKKAKARGEDFVPESDEKREQVFESMSISSEAGMSYDIPSSSTHGNIPNYDANEDGYSEIHKLVKPPNQGSFNMFKYLQGRGYYLSPGLRFGGQFLAYPGDPLRFHSHHTAIGFQNDEKFGVLDIVGGGRLGTAVKKSWVVGAQEDYSNEYRIYSVEWAGFG